MTKYKTILAPGAPWPTYDTPKEKSLPSPKRTKRNNDPVCFIHLPIKTMIFCKEDVEFIRNLQRNS